MTVDYDPQRGIIYTAFHMQSTVIPLVLLKPEFYILLGINVSVTYSRRTGYFDPIDLHIPLAMKLTSITGSLMTFFVVFYNGNVFSRYQRLYELTKAMIENCIYIVSIADKELHDKALVRKLTRWLLCSAFVFLFERTTAGDKSGVAVGETEWAQLSNLGLLQDRELEWLKRHCQALKTHAMPSFVLLHWSMKLYRQHSSRIPDLDKTYWLVRKCQEDVVEMMDLPMPFQYFHIMNMMLMLNLILWAYSLGLEETYFAPMIFLFVQLMFQGMRELSVALSDPFGDDDTDFPLNAWMTGLYLKCYCLVEENYEVAVPQPEEQAPLMQLAEGENIVDVLVDEHSAMRNRGKKSVVVPAKTKPKAKPTTHKTEDGRGEYKELPQKSHGKQQEEEHDHEEEEEDE